MKIKHFWKLINLLKYLISVHFLPFTSKSLKLTEIDVWNRRICRTNGLDRSIGDANKTYTIELERTEMVSPLFNLYFVV